MKPLAIARRLFSSRFHFPVVILKSKRMQRFFFCCFFNEKTVAMISFTARLSSLLLFLGLPRPTTAWHRNETGRRGQWHQRMDIKRRAQLDPATIVRCGHFHSRQASQNCKGTVTRAVSWRILYICQPGGQKGAFSLMICVMADGCLSQGGSEWTQRPWSVVALG